jgi:endonuclease/exonuclease/phosphatase family metal-dependent hydrolase
VITGLLIVGPGLPLGAQAPAFTVATWNIRSGYGAAVPGTSAAFDMNTSNCGDPARPRNAWGNGLPQRVLREAIDESVIALGLQEAWGGCGNVRNVAAELGWTARSPERGGVGLIARYGILGTWEAWQIEFRGVAGAPEDRWIVGAAVCVTADCASTINVWTTHLSATVDAEWPYHTGKVLEWLSRRKVPHVVLGDFNIWQNDQWSPATHCGRATPPMAAALARFAAAGYVDAWAASQPGAGWTATLGRAGCGETAGGTAFKRVDYIWVRGLDVIATSRFGVALPGQPAASDHAGVKATILDVP